MELLILLAAGLAGGAALLLQAKTLPSEDDFKKAKDVLDKDLTNPAANNTVGKYLAFVVGDYDLAMPYLIYSPDKTLQSLAEHELDSTNVNTPQKQVVMADEWVAAAKKLPPLASILYDRAAQWYGKAWPKLDAQWKAKARIQGRKLAISRPPGVARKGLPSGWVEDTGLAGRPAVLDGAVARTGSYSVRIPAADEKVKGSGSSFRSQVVVVTGKTFEASAYLLCDETESVSDRIYVLFFDQSNRQVGMPANFSPVDVPFWTRVTFKGDVPGTAVRAQFGAENYSKKGNMWIDDISLKFDGKEALTNPSFEQK